jgi:hypothetical protein
LFDLVERLNAKIAFEVSGDSLELMAGQCPDVFEKLLRLMTSGLVEPVASPQTHIMLSNVGPEVALLSLREGLNTWERLTGRRPTTGWNPECGWAWYIPEVFREAGFEIMVGDADSYLLSAFPEIREATGLRFDVRGHSNKNALFRIEPAIKSRPEILERLFRPHVLDNGLKVVLRSDMLCNIMLWFLMGAPEEQRDRPIDLDEVRETLVRWRGRIPQGDGYIMPYAEDAEYIGTTAYFYVKQFGKARFFESAPESLVRFEHILQAAVEAGYELMTPSEVVERVALIPGEGFERVENGSAWHGGTAKAWANTLYSRVLDPVCRSVFEGLCDLAECAVVDDLLTEEDFRQAARGVITAYVSDARWPPAPTSPGRFNVEEALRGLESANAGIERLMKARGLSDQRGVYSPGIMASQIAAVREELMALDYFGE